jgi:hypothetical protein
MHKKLQFNYLLKSVLIMGLLILEGPFFNTSYAQSETPTNPNIPKENIKAEAPQEEHNTEDLEKLLKRYNKDSEKIIEDTSKLHNIQEGEAVNEADLAAMKASKAEANEASEAKANESMNPGYKLNPNFGKIKAAPPKVIPTDLSNSVRMALEPLQKLSEEELLKRLNEATKDSPVRRYMDDFPHLTILTIRLIKDKESIPSLVKIVEDKNRLINYVAIMVCTIIVGFVLKNIMHKEGRTFIRSACYFFIRTLLLLALRIAITEYFFSEELAPAVKVFKQTFM